MSTDPLFEFLSGDRDSLANKIYRRTSVCKHYRRFPQITLPAPDEVTEGISTALRKRKTVREYQGKPLSQAHISTILFWSAGLLGENSREGGGKKPWRTHPSAGALFPLELYPIILRGERIPHGVYHYNIEDHALEHIVTANIDAAAEGLGKDIAAYTDMVKQSSMTVVLSFIKGRSMSKYKEFAYKLAFLEGGHIGQNLCLLSSAYGIGSCCLGMRRSFSHLNKALELDGMYETAFYAVSIGHKKK